MNNVALLLDLFGNSEETKLLICAAIFVWCLQRHRNGGLNNGLKSAIIVTDALLWPDILLRLTVYYSIYFKSKLNQQKILFSS